MSGTAQVRGCGGQCPAAAIDAKLLADLFKFPVAQIMKKIFAAAILGVLKTFRHDARCGEMPEIYVLGVIPSDKKVQQSIAVVVKPDGGIRIDPWRQAGLLSYARESMAFVVVEQFRTSPLDEEKIFVSVIVVVSPHRAG